MKIKSLLKHNLMRAAMTLALILACATAWAQTVQNVTYIDVYGQPQTVSATPIVDGYTAMELTAGQWYVVSGNVIRDHESITVTGGGAANIILADGAKFTYFGTYATIDGSLNIYGQSEGTGKFDFDNSTGNPENSELITGNLTVYGGDVRLIGHDVEWEAACQTAVYGNVTIYRGSLYAKGGSHPLGGSNAIDGNVYFYGGRFEAHGGDGNDQNCYGINGNIYLSWSSTSDQFFCDSHNNYSFGITIEANKVFVDNENTIHSSANVGNIDGHTLQPLTGLHQNGDVYTICDATGWDSFCDLLAGNDNTFFSGKTVKLEADISVTRMAGSSGHDFRGTFDGQGHTLTVNYNTSEQYAAPFRNVENGCVIENLIVAGKITTSAKNAAGIAANQYGTVTIRNCRSSVTIQSSVNGDGTHGGFVGNKGNSDYAHLYIEGCVFDGRIISSGTGATTDCGGFVGWKGDKGSLSITNSLYAPTHSWFLVNTGATFARNWTMPSGANCYYTRTLGTAQGKQARSISKGDYVTTLEIDGTATHSYDVSGLSFYNAGLKYGDVLYAGSGETVSLTLDNTVPEGFTFTDYSVTEGAILSGSGNAYTLTMPDADVVITANTNVNYIDVNGAAQQCTDYIWLTGTETTLGAAGQETWCVVQGTLNYSHGIQLLGNTHIILCDGAAMNIGTSDNPVSGTSYQENVGFYGGETFNLSLYAQSGNTGTLTIYSQWCSFDVKDLTIAGGNLNATTITTSPVIGCSNNLTVRRSALEIHTNGPAVQANGDVALSNVTANINSSNNVGFSCSNFAVDNSQLTVNTRAEAIVANNGIITLSNVTANLNSSNAFGLVCSNFTVDNSQLTVTAPNPAIRASVITLGCTAATDFIKATNTSSLNYSYYGTVKIADGQTLYDGANAYTGTLTDAERQTIGGRKLTNVAPPTYDYIGLNGTGATHTAVVIDADNMPTALSGWYIVQGTVSYTNTIDLAGDTHIILADNAVMNVTVTGYNNGIQSTSGNNYSLFVYGQTGQSGELNVTSDRFACYIIYGGDITIAGGKVTASGTMGIHAQYNNNGGNVTIKNATVTATGTSFYGILSEYGGNITIDNSNVTATGNYGIYAQNGDITIASGTVTASGTQNGIFTENGSVTINGGQVTATGNFGIYTIGSVTINGGQVTTTGNNYGIFAQNSSDHITLGWTNPTDYIYANKYYTYGTLSIADGKAFIDEAGNTYSSGTVNASDINGKTLYPNCVVRKQVAGYGEGNGGWVFIASPVAGSIAPSEVHNLLGQKISEDPEPLYDFDFYRFNQSADLEWQNYHQHNADATNPFNTLVNGQGYLYATKETRTLVFAGEYTATTEPVEVPLDYDENADLAGWNLVGNPFTVGATSSQPYYRMNAEGTALKTETETTAVAAMEGVFVQATGNNPQVTFTAQTRGGEQATIAQVNIMVGGDNGAVIDNAIIRFDGGQTLEKFSFREGSTKLDIPQDGTDYAIACAESTGEMPVNFKAEENGTYTLTVSTTLNSQLSTLNFNYLHLIDNLTGADVDLLTSPNYTFTAKTTDYESRFKLVFSICEDANGDNEAFAFISNGNIIVNGEGTLQIFDILGHQLVTKQLPTLNSKLSTLNYKSGVYVLRLINGENVRTQKMVIE